MSFEHFAAAGLTLIACVPDLRSRRIPNALTFGAAAAAIVFHLLSHGWPSAAASMGGWLVGFLLFFPLFALRGMGAGDVKLLAAVGAWLGPSDVIWVALLTCLAGGVLGLIVAAFHGYLRKAVGNVFLLLMHWRLFGIRPMEEMTLAGNAGPRLAYAVPIAIGTLTSFWWKP